MLYKVTPMLPEPEAKPKKAREPGQPRKKRKSAIYDHEGNEVLITLMCLKCRTVKPLAQFGLRKMADGAIRNQPWCRGCRSGAGVPKPKVTEATAEVAPASEAAPVALVAETVSATTELPVAIVPVEAAAVESAPVSADEVSSVDEATPATDVPEPDASGDGSYAI